MSVEISRHFLDEPAQRAGFVVLGAFLVSFLFIRTSARLIRNPRITWWPGSVETKGGLHLHHLVWGIVLLLLSGFLNFALEPEGVWLYVLAALFGVGAGLTLDEFALWVHLEDVYWSDQGRSSFDAVVVAALLGGLIVLGLAPFELSHQGSAVTTLVLVVAIDPQGQAAARPDGRVHPVRVAGRLAAAGLAVLTLGALALRARRREDGPLKAALRTHLRPAAAHPRRDCRRSKRGRKFLNDGTS